MRGHDDLADRRLFHPAHQFQEFHLARRRQRGFRFVEDEEALPLAALLEETHEPLAVRMRQEIRIRAPDLVEIPRDGKEALGPEEPAVGDLRQPTGAKRLRKRPTHGLGRVGVIDRPVALAAASLVVPRHYRDALQQGRLPRPVLADDDGDRPIEILLEIIAQERQAERIGLAIGDPRRIEPDAPEVWRRHVDCLVVSSRHTSAPREQDGVRCLSYIGPAIPDSDPTAPHPPCPAPPTPSFATPSWPSSRSPAFMAAPSANSVRISSVPTKAAKRSCW